MMKKIFLLAMMAMLIFCAGCDPQTNPPEKPETPKESKLEQPEKKVDTEKTAKPEMPKDESNKKFLTQNIKVFYPDENATVLIAVPRTIKFVDESEKYSAALSELMQTPKEQGLTNIFPKHTKIKNVSLNADTVIIDFDKDIAKNFVGGSTGEEFFIYSIVNTLTEFPEVKQVKFLIDGQEVETLAGHMDLSEPLSRSIDVK